ncbi:MAG: TRAP transporter permease [Pseudomonadota bacterium]
MALSFQSAAEKYDPELQFRPLTTPAAGVSSVLLVTLSVFHYYTAGFGLLREDIHRGIHLALVLSLIYLLFGFRKTKQNKHSLLRFGNVPLFDWVLAALAFTVALYRPMIFTELTFRIGAPNTADILAGTCTIFIILEATRRTLGITLPLIVSGFLLYALAGPYLPAILLHPGTSWESLVNHLYLTSQGIFGIPVGVVATYVFHFVLFGVLANKIGAGQLFIDLASCVAGRFAGGPAKVSVFSSGLFGMISGSSIANTVTTGSITIPAMKRIGYPAHFAAAVEATASTGGQITPPIMGAAAFVMIEFLQIPYRDILIAALMPALMHYLGVFTMVHLEAKRLDLRGLKPDEMPHLPSVIRQRWMALLPLLILISLLLIGRSPYYAAFWGITACIVIGFIQPKDRLTLKSLSECLQLGAKYALAVGASAAAVGMIVGVVTLTGLGFKVSFLVNQGATEISNALMVFIPGSWFAPQSMTMLLTLIMTAISCILLGVGLPTTATYIVLVTIAAPALGMLGISPLVAHFFVFYYGVLADITPPVALAAYAGAGIAGANPFKTGNTAFRLGAAKALVPFVFVYSPSLLIVVEGFSWSELCLTASACAVGIVLLAGSLTGYMLRPLAWAFRWILAIAALLLVAPGITSDAIGIALAFPVVVYQFMRKKKLLFDSVRV